MMALVDKIKTIYPDLTSDDFETFIRLRNDSDGKGDYIKEWNHPTKTKPTDEELA